jgi:hypothetical protein
MTNRVTQWLVARFNAKGRCERTMRKKAPGCRGFKVNGRSPRDKSLDSPDPIPKLAEVPRVGDRAGAKFESGSIQTEPFRGTRRRRTLSLRVFGFSFVSDTRRLGGRAGRNRFDCALTNLGRGASDAHGHLHPPVLDASASRLITGRFVLLPKNLVTGVAKTRIVSRPTRRGAGLPLEGDYLEAPAESGLLSGRRKSMYTLNASILPSGPPEYHVAYRDPAQRPCTQHRDVSKEGATGCPAGGDLAYGLSSALRRLRTRHTPGHAAAWARRV